MAAAAVASPVNEAGLLQVMLRRPSVAIGLAIFVLIVLTAIFAPLITPYDPNKLAIVQRLKPPSSAHFFGTDEFLARPVTF